MKIELLVFEGCPNWEPARALLRDCMATLGITRSITEIHVDTPEMARLLEFPGSPTLRVNDADAASLPETVEWSLTCRTYLVNGRLQGVPAREWVMEALRKAQEAESHHCCIPVAAPKGEIHCPFSGAKGKPVKSVTLRALLKPEMRGQVRDEVYRFCGDPTCDVVYFSADGSQTFTKEDLAVRVGTKETEAPRPLCYCFGHSVESMLDEWMATGSLSALEAIKAEMKAGTCRCEVTNPSGGCCLGDVLKAAKEIQGMTQPPASPDEKEKAMYAEHDCCPPVPSTSKASGEECCAIPSKDVSAKAEGVDEPGKARTTWAAMGLGVLASACCWVPLALAGVGVATGTLGAKIAWIRPWALWGLVLLLVGVLGWWARKRFFPVKECGDCCAVVPKFPALPVVILAASFVLAWASPRILHPGRNATLTTTALIAPAGGTLLVISTPQFDCAPCVGTLPQTMQATPGVASVQMDFDKRETRVAFQPGADVDATLSNWKRDLGFDGKELNRQIQ